MERLSRLLQGNAAAGISDLAWQRFHDPDEPMFLLGGYVDGKLTGFAHYLFHRSTWAPGNYCYLEDLFVSESARGRGVGRALIEAVYDKAEAAGASRVYWLTQTEQCAGAHPLRPGRRQFRLHAISQTVVRLRCRRDGRSGEATCPIFPR